MSSTTVIDRPEADTASGTAPLATRARWSRRIAMDLVALADMLAVAFGGFLPAYIYATTGEIPLDWLIVAQCSVLAAFMVQVCLRAWGFYETSKLHALPEDSAALFTALVIGIVGVLALCLPQTLRSAHMWVWFLAWLSASFTLLLGVRLVSRPLLATLAAAGLYEEAVAVFGAGSIARRVKEHLSNSDQGVRFAGVFDDRLGDERIDTEGLALAGTLTDLTAAVRRDRIDRIVVALPQGADRRLSDVVRKLEQLPVSVHIVTHIATDLLPSGNAHAVSCLGPVGLMDVKRKPLSDWAPIVKRCEDLVLGCLLLLIAMPLMPAIALAIKLDSRGPVLFRQRRRGLNQRVFEVLKFRTMSVMEDGTDVRQVGTSDPRVTRVGRFLRRMSLDELPQVWNVLHGDMSLVGPRPHALIHDDEFGQLLEDYAGRHQVRPGITGLAQVEGWRGETATADKMRARVDLDIAYIKSWSLWLDLKILMRTFGAVILGKNAN